MRECTYVTKVSTGIGRSAGNEFARSALGKYSVYENEKVIIYGFNLKGAARSAKINGTSVTPVLNVDSLEIPIGTTATSGKLEISIGATNETLIPVLNNLNHNPTFDTDGQTITGYEYNSQANGKNNNRLNDDVEFVIWNMGKFVNSTNITSPMMKMDASSNWYMSYGNGVPSMYVNKNGTTTQVDYSYNMFQNTNVAFDSSGNIYAVATNTDRVNNKSARYVFYTGKSNDYSGTDSYNYTYSDNYKHHLEQVYNGTTGVYDINRVQRPKMFITGARTTANPAKIYMSYFDANNTINPVKFRYGTSNAANNATGGVAGSVNGDTGQSNNPSTTDSSYKDYHIVASDNTTYKGGAYSAVGATSSGTAVVAWYDASERRLIYSYNTTPETSVVGGVWQTNAIVIDNDYAGWYVDMIVDEDDGIHIAYYNSAKGDLKYAYLSSYNDTTPEVVTVDSYLSAGTNITINTRKENGKCVPYISYFYSSFTQTPNSVRIAWQNDMSGKKNGAEDDKYTGAWECMTIPTQNIPSDATICNGVPTSGAYGGTQVLGYMSDAGYERAYIKY